MKMMRAKVSRHRVAKPERQLRTSAPFFVFILAALLTLAVTYYVSVTAEAKDQLRFQNYVQQTRNSIENRLETYVALLRATSGLFAASELVTRDEFRTFVDHLELPRRYPGVQGIGFSIRVRPEEKDALEAQMRSQGLNDFRVKPEGARPEYHSVIYLEPLDRRNQVAIGYDMFTEQVRRAAMERARNTGLPAASGKVTLVQEIDPEKQAGFLIYLPVYRHGRLLGTAAERQAALEGFVYSPFRTDDLLGGILGNESDQGVDFQVFDGEPSPANLLHDSGRTRRPGRHSSRPHFTAATMIEIGGRPWNFFFVSRPELESASERRWGPLILLGGLAISLVLFGVTRSLARARAEAERIAADLRQSEEALRESESRLRRLVDASIIGILIADVHGHVLEANDACLKLVGYTREDLQAGKINWADLAPPEHRHLDERAIEEMRQTGGHPPVEKEYLRKDGTRVPVLIGTTYLGGPQELVAGFLLDLAGRKREEAALRFLSEASAALTSSLDYEVTLTSVAHMAVPYFADWCAVDLATEDGSFRRVASSHLNPSKVELVKELQRRYPPDPHATYGVPQVLRTGQPELYPEFSNSMLAAAARDAEHLSLIRALGLKSAIVVPLVARGRTLGAITFVTGSSGRRYTEADLNLSMDLARRAALAIDNARLYQQAQEANRIKDEFLATVSHELRTPLNAMIGWIYLLHTGKLDEAAAARALETIRRNAYSQAQIVDDILDVSRIITGKLHLEARPVELHPVIEAALESVRPAAEAKAIQLQPLLDSRAGQVSGDPSRLQQVVWNLLSNAIKFTPRGGRVEVRLARVDSHLEIAVSDTGQGISPEFLPHVFERFRQADSSSTRAYGGLGLGLAIVRHLVELHGGTVHAESPGQGQGATFTVKLPLSPLRSSDYGLRNETAADAQSATYNSPSAILEGLRVLLVDDDANTLEILSAVLAECGAQLLTAASAAEALKSLPQWKPDILICDIGMPGEDGYSLISKVRALAPEFGGQLPAVALTAYARAEDRRRALQAGFQIHVPKPVEPAELVTVVASLTGRLQRH